MKPIPRRGALDIRTYRVIVTLIDPDKPDLKPQAFAFCGSRPQLIKAIRSQLGLDGKAIYGLAKHNKAEYHTNGRVLRYEIEEVKGAKP